MHASHFPPTSPKLIMISNRTLKKRLASVNEDAHVNYRPLDLSISLRHREHLRAYGLQKIAYGVSYRGCSICVGLDAEKSDIPRDPITLLRTNVLFVRNVKKNSTHSCTFFSLKKSPCC
ncbi:hypothetical protein MIMGU_mgv1a016507mg [Erythranthe guttata]|uniref:Uncharacterized protein n=1 Tax=Erythranthe guttata TaxID=4155 RepID=A0A022QR67_ERYGU|nr:hypothetical protein MIMGU_mgv1a016507mg [Erythranthe guttata]